MRAILSFVMFIWAASTAQAQVNSSVVDLAKAVGVSEVIEIMRIEGLDSTSDLAVSFLGRPSRSLDRDVDRIYSTSRMQEIVLRGMADVLVGKDPEPITAFFRSELGVKIIGLELSAREAFLDEGVEEASIAFAERLSDEDPDRFALIEGFIETNDLVESNVMGALNSNYAFLTGLLDGGGFEEGVTEQDILQQVWAQEGEIRDDTTEWLFSYLSLAYQPLSDEELAIYLDFSSSAHGKLLNQALFAGFDAMFIELSNEVGLALGDASTAEEL